MNEPDRVCMACLRQEREEGQHPPRELLSPNHLPALLTPTPAIVRNLQRTENHQERPSETQRAFVLPYRYGDKKDGTKDRFKDSLFRIAKPLCVAFSKNVSIWRDLPRSSRAEVVVSSGLSTLAEGVCVSWVV